MTIKKIITFTVELSDDEEKNPIQKNDLFYFEQGDTGLPTIYRHQGRKGEDWDGFYGSKNGKKSYLKIVGISGLLLRCFCINGEPLFTNNPITKK
jgi:hypothetical protein